MKRILTLILALLLFASLALSATASTADLSDYILALKASYQEKLVLTSFEETLGMAALDGMRGRTPFYPESDGTAKTLSLRILAYTATDSVPEVFPEGDDLALLQDADGSFGDLKTHCLSMLALRTLGKSYNSAKAYEFVLSNQKEDGSFGQSAQETALCITVLSLSDNAREINAVRFALEYLSSYRATNLPDLCWQMIGLTDGGVNALTIGDSSRLERLLSYATEKGNYALTAGSQDADEDATALALLTLDAVNRDKSAFKRLAENGLMKRYGFADFKPLITFFAILLIIAIGFWAYVFLHKKHDKTLEETKKY